MAIIPSVGGASANVLSNQLLGISQADASLGDNLRMEIASANRAKQLGVFDAVTTFFAEQERKRQERHAENERKSAARTKTYATIGGLALGGVGGFLAAPALGMTGLGGSLLGASIGSQAGGGVGDLITGSPGGSQAIQGAAQSASDAIVASPYYKKKNGERFPVPEKPQPEVNTNNPPTTFETGPLKLPDPFEIAPMGQVGQVDLLGLDQVNAAA